MYRGKRPRRKVKVGDVLELRDAKKNVGRSVLWSTYQIFAVSARGCGFTGTNIHPIGFQKERNQHAAVAKFKRDRPDDVPEYAHYLVAAMVATKEKRV